MSQHTQYFMTHTLSRLPREFFFRIGDLVKTKYIDDVMIVFYEAEKMMDEAEEFLWLISDQHLVSAIPHMKNALENNAKLKILLPSDLPFPEEYFDQECVKEYSIVEKQARKEGRLEERWIDRMDIAMGISEKCEGRIFFQTLKGNFDYKGFKVTEKISHEYCKDLFEYYWNKASTKIPKQVLESYY